MSGFASFIPAAISLTQSALKDSANSDAIDAQNDAIDRHNQLIAAQQAQQQEQQQNLLEQQQATARANMAAMGSGGDGGSGDALLAGMAARAAQSTADSNLLAQYRYTPHVSDSSASSLLDNGLSQGLSVFSSFYGGMD